jgi:dienelactone hydrolase
MNCSLKTNRPQSSKERWRPLGLLLAITGLTACATPAQKFERRAQAANLERVEIAGTQFSHLLYRKPGTARKTVLVFLEGDGTPASERFGIEPDPTATQPLALELMLQSPSAWYLTRPCYNGMQQGCNPSLWTVARYSSAVVDSLVAALDRYARTQGNPRLILVGHSGGGALAVLMAARLPQVRGVITVAANLDTVAWAKHRGYDAAALAASLNPVDAILAVPAVHLLGERDRNVPPQTLAHYFAAHPNDQVWRYSDFDHHCCWRREWLGLLNKALTYVESKAAQRPF